MTEATDIPLGVAFAAESTAYIAKAKTPRTLKTARGLNNAQTTN
jgi:hypothetical protein